MRKHAVFSVVLIFLFTIALLWAGLNLAERSLQELCGTEVAPSAFSLWREHSGEWVFSFGGRSTQLNNRLWQVFRQVTGQK